MTLNAVLAARPKIFFQCHLVRLLVISIPLKPFICAFVRFYMISFPLKPFICAVCVYFTGLSFVPFVFILQVLHSGVLLHCADNMIYFQTQD